MMVCNTIHLGEILKLRLLMANAGLVMDDCLPAGPLREPISRLDSVDFVVSKYIAGRHEYKMEYPMVI